MEAIEVGMSNDSLELCDDGFVLRGTEDRRSV